MKIRIQYDNHTTTFEVPDEDFSLMIQLDFEERLARAKDPGTVRRRSPQEIMNDRFNKPDLNGWKKYWKHVNDRAIPPRLDHKAGGFLRNPDLYDSQRRYSLDDFPGDSDLYDSNEQDDYEELCAVIRKVLKPDYAEMLIAIHLDGMSVTEYAEKIGDTRTNVSHRLQRAKKLFGNLYQNVPFDPFL